MGNQSGLGARLSGTAVQAPLAPVRVDEVREVLETVPLVLVVTGESRGIEAQPGLLHLEVADDRALDAHREIRTGTDLAEVGLAVENRLLADEVADRRHEVIDGRAQRLLRLADAGQTLLRLGAEPGDDPGYLIIEHDSPVTGRHHIADGCSDDSPILAHAPGNRQAPDSASRIRSWSTPGRITSRSPVRAKPDAS